LVSEIEYNIEKMNKIVYDIIREGV